MDSTPVFACGNIMVKFTTPVDPSSFKEKAEFYETVTVVLVKFLQYISSLELGFVMFNWKELEPVCRSDAECSDFPSNLFISYQQLHSTCGPG